MSFRRPSSSHWPHLMYDRDQTSRHVTPGFQSICHSNGLFSRHRQRSFGDGEYWPVSPILCRHNILLYRSNILVLKKTCTYYWYLYFNVSICHKISVTANKIYQRRDKICDATWTITCGSLVVRSKLADVVWSRGALPRFCTVIAPVNLAPCN